MSRTKQLHKERTRLQAERALALKIGQSTRPNRMGLLIDAERHRTLVSDGCWWQLVGAVWRDRDGSEPMETWALLLSSKRPERYRFMRREEIDAFATLPAELTLYRAGPDLPAGSTHAQPMLDWRVDAALARQEADAAGLKLMATKVTRREVLAVSWRRDALEIVLHPNGGVENRE